jgi:crooked neck
METIYIYLWIYYAIYEEMTNRDLNRALDVYKTCLDIIPHNKFSFSKIWLYAAKLYIRKNDLTSARKLLGRAIGQCGKERFYTQYIDIELSLGEIDRCRILYSQYLKAMPYNSKAWCKFADLEQSVGETDRCRAIYELATSQHTIDMPEILWKAYIDYEIKEGEYDNVRSLYERLLKKTNGHVKVWISYAQFEGSVVGHNGSSNNNVEKGREIFQKSYDQFKQRCIEEENNNHDDRTMGTSDTTATTKNTIKEDRLLLLDLLCDKICLL